MTTGIVIFSRFDSKRLPGKALIEIAGRSLLGRVIDRARQVRGTDTIILATSDRAVDDPLAAFAAAEGIGVFRGDVNDVAGRALAAARAFGLSRFARLCGDRPFFDPALMDRVLNVHAKGGDLASTQGDRPYPPGLTTEVVAVNALAAACAAMTEAEDREHLTRYFYQHPDRFHIVQVPAPVEMDFAGIRLVVDDETDLSRARFMAEALGAAAPVADMQTVFGLARAWAAAQPAVA